MELQQRGQQSKTALSNELPDIAIPSLITLPPATEKTYHGVRLSGGKCEVWIEEPLIPALSEQIRRWWHSLPLHLEVFNHSPAGFEWGYGGSGPAQLALALLMDATGDERLALRNYQDFKFRFVADWGETWRISAKEIQDFAAKNISDIEEFTTD